MLAAERHLAVLAFLTSSPIPALQTPAAMLLPAPPPRAGIGECRLAVLGVRADGAVLALPAAAAPAETCPR